MVVRLVVKGGWLNEKEIYSLSLNPSTIGLKLVSLPPTLLRVPRGIPVASEQLALHQTT